MKRLLLILLAASAACSRSPSSSEYRPAGGGFRLETPVGWASNERGPFTRRPIGEIWWIGKMVGEHEGWPVGALILVRRLDRHPGKDEERYRKDVLSQTDALFRGDQPADLILKKGNLVGKPARWYRRDFEETTGGGIHGTSKSFPSTVSGVVVQTPEAYYVLEYRATRELFDEYESDFRRLVSTFKTDS